MHDSSTPQAQSSHRSPGGDRNAECDAGVRSRGTDRGHDSLREVLDIELHADTDVRRDLDAQGERAVNPNPRMPGRS